MKSASARMRTGLTSIGADLAIARSPEQTIKLLLGNAVALARATEQAAAIDDRDVAAFVADEAGPLQGARRSRNARPLYPQHHGQELLRQQKLIRVHAIVRHQQPAATSLL